MTILIKGMEMPENCDDCFLGDFYCEKCQHIDGYKMAGSRPFNCPLVPIPTPHSRLGDLDELLQEAKDLSGPLTGDGWDNYGVYALIERQLTVIEAEE